jgi:hypothetical protein
MAALIADDETFPIYETPTDARRWWIAQTRRFPRGFSRLGCGSTIVASAMAYLRRMDFGASPWHAQATWDVRKGQQLARS